MDLTRRASFASHRLLGWIFWDQRAKDNLAALGVPDGLGHYIVNRGAPLAPAGAEAVFARAQVKALRQEARSLMPEGLESGLSPSDVAGLLAWLTVRPNTSPP